MLATVVMVAALAGCGGATASPDDAAAVAAVRQGRAEEVTVQGPVLAVLADASGPHGPHQRFTVDIGSGVVVEVDHNLSLAPRVPLHRGDVVIVHGQLALDPGRVVVHDTHHSTGSHEGGWVELGGQRYE